MQFEWKQVGKDKWVTTPNGDGLYGLVHAEEASDGETEYWGMTCIDNDIPFGPMETSELEMSLDDAKKVVEARLSEDLGFQPSR
jgi:hypothetical protein